MNFHRLLRPYQEGGTESNHVRRDMGTIVNYLVNKKGYPLDVVGGALFKIFMWLDAGNKFEGDGKYGSKGKELVTSIRMQCDHLMREKLEAITYKMFVQQYAKDLKHYLKPWPLRVYLEMRDGDFKIDHSPL